jgi:hypothetical protein
MRHVLQLECISNELLRYMSIHMQIHNLLPELHVPRKWKLQR